VFHPKKKMPVTDFNRISTNDSLPPHLQDDEDLVLEFVCNQGLDALVSVGRNSDQTYQQYILKALGELVVYVDGMHGLI